MRNKVLIILTLLLVLCGASAQAAPTLVQQTTCSSSATTVSCTLAGVVAGHALVIAYGASTSLVPVFSDNLSDTFSIAHDIDNASGNSAALGFSVNVAGGSTTVTATLTSAHGQSMNVSEWSGLATAGQPDDNGAGTTGNSTTISTGSSTPANANDLVVGVSVIAANTAPTSGPTGGFTGLTAVSQGGLFANSGYLVASSGAQTATWAYAASQQFAGIAFSLKAAVAPVTQSGFIFLGAFAPPPQTGGTSEACGLAGYTAPAPPSNFNDPAVCCGADSTGATNSAQAIANAFTTTSGTCTTTPCNVYFNTAGTYLVNPTTGTPSYCGTTFCGIRPPSGTAVNPVIVQGKAGVILKTTRTDASNEYGIFQLLTGSSHIRFFGPMILEGGYSSFTQSDDNAQMGIEISGSTSDVIFAGLTFGCSGSTPCGFSGNSDIHFDGNTSPSGTGSGGNNGTEVKNCLFNAAMLYGVAATDASNNLIDWDQFIDAGVGGEDDQFSTGPNQHNTYSNNCISQVHGTSTNGGDGGEVFGTGGTFPPGANYSTDQFNTNSFGPGTTFLDSSCSGCTAASYTGNVCPASGTCTVQ